MAAELAALRAGFEAKMAAVVQQMEELRRENMQLRQELAAARGVHQHQPYSFTPRLPPLAPPPLAFSPERPTPEAHTRPLPQTPPVDVDAQGEALMHSPAPEGEAKKARRTLAMTAEAAAIVAASSLASASGQSGGTLLNE
jgi:hypothetical protein